MSKDDDRKTMCITVSSQTYANLKALSKKISTPMNKIINAILIGYFKSRIEREKRT
jgi:hypothetical protein